MKEEGSTEVLIPILFYLLIPLNVSQISEPVFIIAKNFKVSSNKMRLFVCFYSFSFPPVYQVLQK